MHRLAYSYIRFSTPEQAKSHSYDRQMAAARSWASANGYDLSESPFEDLGVSAYKGKNRTEGALAKFLTAVEEGVVPPGSVLIVESIDRLSRDQVRNTLRLFMDILESDISIVTLTDNRHYTKESTNDITDLFASLIYMSRAHEESATKSYRGKESWEKKRRSAREHGAPITARLPGWLRMNKSTKRIELIQDRADLVNKMYEWNAAGLGARAITKRLNDIKAPTFSTRTTEWQRSSVVKILTSRAVMGEYQPHTGRAGERTPVGDPIRDYFPAIVSPNLFYRAASIRQDGAAKGGRRGENFNNLFKGIAKCASCNAPMYYINKGCSPKGGAYLACSKSERGTCDNNTIWHYRRVETVILMRLVDHVSWIGSLSVNPASNYKLLQELEAAKGELSAVKERVKRYQGLFEEADHKILDSAKSRYLESLVEHDSVSQRISSLQQKIESTNQVSQHANLFQVAHALRALYKETDSTKLYDARSKLHQALTSTINEIKFGKNRYLAVSLKNDVSIEISSTPVQWTLNWKDAEVKIESIISRAAKKIAIGEGVGLE